MDGDLKKIRIVGEYMIEVWKAAGMNMENVEFLVRIRLTKISHLLSISVGSSFRVSLFCIFWSNLRATFVPVAISAYLPVSGLGSCFHPTPVLVPLTHSIPAPPHAHTASDGVCSGPLTRSTAARTSTGFVSWTSPPSSTSSACCDAAPSWADRWVLGSALCSSAQCPMSRLPQLNPAVANAVTADVVMLLKLVTLSGVVGSLVVGWFPLTHSTNCACCSSLACYSTDATAVDHPLPPPLCAGVRGGPCRPDPVPRHAVR